MKINMNLKFAALTALAVTLLCQTSITRADDRGKRDNLGQQAKVTFTKWVTAWPLMAGVAGGVVGDGSFAGEVLKYTSGPVTTIEALYHVTGPKHSFTALVHVEQTGLKAVIIGVVTDGWLKGHAVQGEYTQIVCEHDGIASPCYQGSLEIQRDSRD